MRKVLKNAALVIFLGCLAEAQAVDIETVIVADPGNVSDNTGFGRVDYTYKIGKYEVTNAQYRVFLNAVAATDTFNLYNPEMSGEYGGIIRIGTSGNYTYAEKAPGWDTKPVNFVSWEESFRFANWLHNGQPTGVQNNLTTEDGAYTFTGERQVGPRNPGAKVFLPSENEWYKAAYYKGGGTNAGYWDYATRSDICPNNNPPGQDTGNSANYYSNGYSVGSPFYSTEVGAYALSYSPYGTYDQNGNVWEWNESIFHSDGAYGRRGGCWSTGGTAASLMADAREDHGGYAYTVSNDIGFRVAEVPEPATLSLIVLGGLALLRRQKA
jgi:formylglycine-generating enzyme